MAKYGLIKYGQGKYGEGEASWIFNRTLADINNNTVLAYINYNDLNRIEMRMEELKHSFIDAGYYNCDITTKTDWQKISADNSIDYDNIPTKDKCHRIINNLKILINAFYTYRTTPNSPDTMVKIDYIKMNNMEKILFDLYLMIANVKRNYRECGTFECRVE